LHSYRAGPPIETIEENVFLKAPPISVMLGQEMIETTIVKSEGVSTKKHHLEQSLLSFTCTVNDNGLSIFPFTISVQLESPTSFVERNSVSLMEFKMLNDDGDSDSRPQKRVKQTLNDDGNEEDVYDVMDEVDKLSALIAATIDDDID
jgi:hypothetical protein